MLVHWSAIDKHAAISGIEYEKFKNFAKSFADHIYIQCLVQGNMTKDDVIVNTKKCVEILNCRPLLPNTMPQLRVTQIPLGVRCCRVKNFNLTDSNSVVTNYYQSGGTSIRLSVLIELLIVRDIDLFDLFIIFLETILDNSNNFQMIMEEPLFNQLRTQEQLGYNVFCLLRDTFGILGYSVTACVQADKYTTEHVDKRIEAFLKSFKKMLNEMSEKELLSVKEALTKVKQCADIHLKEELDKNWAEITSGEYVFDRLQREVDAIGEITIEELRKWMEDHTIGGSNLRKLSVQIVGIDGSEKATEAKAVQSNEIVQSGSKKRKLKRKAR